MDDLARLHRRHFTPAIRARGERYWRDGRVRLTDVTEDRATATVSGTHPYGVVLRDYADPSGCASSCSCRNHADWGSCKHVWATLLAVDEVRLQLHEIIATLELEEAETEPGARVRASPRVPPPPSAPPDWRVRLLSIRDAAAAERAPAAGRAVVVEYYLSPSRRSDHSGVAIEARGRARHKSGRLGAPRLTSLSREQRALLPEPDRVLLSLYEQSSRDGYAHWWRPALPRGWDVPRELLPAILPQLIATGRVLRGPVPIDDQCAPHVTIDVAEPFRFEVEVDDSGGGARLRARAVLRRGSETLQLETEPHASQDAAGTEVMLVGTRLVRADWHGAAALARELLRAGPLEVPVAQRADLLRQLASFAGARHFLAASLAHVEAGAPLGVVALQIPRAGKAPVAAALGFDYDGELVARADPTPLVEASGGLQQRDLAAEAQLAQRVAAAGLEEQPDGSFMAPRPQLGKVVSALVTADLRVLAEGKPVRSFAGATCGIRMRRDWLEVEGALEFEGARAALPELLRRSLTPDGFVELGDGSFGVLPEQWLRRIDALRALGAAPGEEVVRLPSSQALLLDAMLESELGEPFAVGAKFARLRERLASFRSVSPAAQPASFRGELRAYQRDGLGWLHVLHDFGLGGCLADDMGLGKTVQVLALLAGLRERRRRAVGPSLLVAPRSVLANWIAEAARFAPDLRVLDFSTPDRWESRDATALRRHDLVLTTYALLRHDAPRFVELELRFHYAILDESQMAKNAASQTSKAARLLRAEHRLALTGTPVENHLGELWSLFEFLNPGMLGRLPAFRALFGATTTAADLARHRELVQRALRPVLLRRTKAQVLPELPAKIEQTLWCELEPGQRRRYDELRLHYRDRLLGPGGGLDGRKRFIVLEALLRLRQAACHEGLIDHRRKSVPSAKLEVLLPRLAQLAEEGHKVLVFSQFTGFLDLVEPELRARDLDFERLDGSTRARAEHVQRFQEDPACRVFLISLKAGGFGLNLTAADYVFVLDPWWNPAAEMQAIDRAHRIGQRHVVHAYRLVCRGTVEERVLELQAEKRALCEAILGNERSLLQELTRADLELLLG